MIARAVVLRPEPGNGETADRLAAAGILPIQQPLFVMRALDWTPPDPAGFDAILLTSANAVRHGGAGLDALKTLPVVAVGTATAAAARAAGFTIAATGKSDAAAIVAEARGFGLNRLLHLAGRDRITVDDDVPTATITVYAADPVDLPAHITEEWEEATILLHSPRAARAFAALVARDGTDRGQFHIAALSDAVAEAAGGGWGGMRVAVSPNDTALVAAAGQRAIDRNPPDGDKRAMTDDQATTPAMTAPSRPPRRARTAWLVTLVLLAFVGGLVLMGYAMRQGLLEARKTEAAAAAPVTFTPQPEAGVGGARAAAPAVDLAPLVSREAGLAAQLSALETRAATVVSDANAAGAQAARAESVLVVLAARRALDRGQGLGYLEDQLRTRFGQRQPRAVAIIVAAGRRPPVTLEDLRLGLDTLAPDLTAGNATDDWWTSLKQEIGNLVVLRRAGTPSPIPTDRLARARRLLDAGRVDAARAEVALMPGAATAAAWNEAARRYMQARAALDALETIAMVAPPAVTPIAPVVPQAAPVTTTDSLPAATVDAPVVQAQPVVPGTVAR